MRRLLRDIGHIHKTWVRFFRSPLNVKSDMLDPDIAKRLPQQPVMENNSIAIKAMANAIAVGLDVYPAELIILSLQQDRTTLPEFHRLTTLV